MVGQIGLEPTMVEPTDLQSSVIAARRLTHMAERAELNLIPISQYDPRCAFCYLLLNLFYTICQSVYVS